MAAGRLPAVRCQRRSSRSSPDEETAVSHRPLTRLALVLTLATVTALGGAAPALAAPGSVDSRVLPDAHLQADGAGVAVRVATSCPDGYTGVVQTEVRQQASGQTHAGAGQSRSFRCDGTPRTVPVGVPSQGPAWHTGGIFVRVTVVVCTVEGCLTQVAVGGATVRGAASSAATQSAGTLSPRLSGMTLSLPATGRLQADGATVTITTRHRCTNWSAAGFTLVQQDADGQFRPASEFVALPCDGTWHSTAIALTRSGQHRGPAFLVADSIACNVVCGLPAVRPFRTISVT